jgi:uncharacterized protein (TIGR02598 family)
MNSPSKSHLHCSKPAPGRSRAQRAFSLVEVTLALGIISFAFVAIFGMLPVALDSARDSIDRTRGAQIAQRLFAETQQTPFDQLGSLVGSVFWFDGEGEEIASATADSGGGPAGYVYSATLSQSGAAPGAAFSGTRTSTMLVKIAKNRDVTGLTRDQKPLLQEAFVVADTAL